MSTAASIYFSHTHYDIKYVQIQNIGTTTAVLTDFVVVIIYTVAEYKPTGRLPILFT